MNRIRVAWAALRHGVTTHRDVEALIAQHLLERNRLVMLARDAARRADELRVERDELLRRLSAAADRLGVLQ